MSIGHVKNWSKFQHYKDRSPPWIKLQKELLDDFEYASLPIASKALAPLIWLLASETTEGSVRMDAEWLAFRLRWTVKDVQSGLTPLIQKGFLIPASTSLAECYQGATPEGEAEGEAEADTPSQKRVKKTAKRSIPDGFSVSDRVKAWASEKGYGKLADHLDAFVRKSKAKGYTYLDWDAAFMEAIREDWAKIRGNGYKGAPASDGYKPLPGEL